jgi:hypothetical protein
MSNRISGLHGARRPPGNTRSRHRFISEEINFAVSKIHGFTVPCGEFEREGSEKHESRAHEIKRMFFAVAQVVFFDLTFFARCGFRKEELSFCRIGCRG